MGVGGGSALDTTKGVSLRLANPGPLQQYFGVELVPQTGAPMILIPTTAGTGSEVTPNAIFDDTERRLKAGIVSHRLLATRRARRSGSDPGPAPGGDRRLRAGRPDSRHGELRRGQGHPHTDLYALEATRLIGANLGTAVGGATGEARYGQMLGSFFAGIAITNAGTGLCHAMAYPLGSAYHVPHGMANALLLPAVLEYNMSADLPKFARLAGALGEPVEGRSLRQAGAPAGRAVRALSRDVGLPPGLREVGVPEEPWRGSSRGPSRPPPGGGPPPPPTPPPRARPPPAGPTGPIRPPAGPGAPAPGRGAGTAPPPPFLPRAIHCTVSAIAPSRPNRGT